MGNVQVPFHTFKLNAWTVDKTLLIWKTLSLSACIVGTSIYFSPLEPYFEVPSFGILVPTFVTGYIIILSADIFIPFTYEEYIFLEVWFAVVGAVGSMICGIYEFYKWIVWIVDVNSDSQKDYNIPEFVLSLMMIIQSTSLTAVVVHRILQQHSSSNEN